MGDSKLKMNDDKTVLIQVIAIVIKSKTSQVTPYLTPMFILSLLLTYHSPNLLEILVST